LAKGIRVSALAKELGVRSKVVLDKLRDEGLGDQAPNHQSTVGVGLATTIRQWFEPGAAEESAGGTATKTAAAPKKKAPKKVAKKAGDDEPAAPEAAARPPMTDDDEDEAGEVEVKAAPTSNGTSTPPRPAPPRPAPPRSTTSTPPPVARPPVATPPRPPAPAIKGPPNLGRRDPKTGRLIPETPPPAPTPPAPTPPPTRPAAKAPVRPAPPRPGQPSRPGQPPRPGQPVRPGAPRPAPPLAGRRPVGTPGTPAVPGQPINPQTGLPEQEMRPTITLEDRQREVQNKIKAEREAKRAAEGPVQAAPQLSELKKVEIAGPKVVRVEAPDHVPTPRRRGEMGGPGGPNRIPTGPIAQGGGGVKARAPGTGTGPGAADQGRSLSGRRRTDGRRGEALEKLREFTDADIIARRDAVNAAKANRSLLDRQMQRTARRGQGFRAPRPGQTAGPVVVKEPITVKSLSNDLGVRSNQILRTLFVKHGARGVNLNSGLDAEQAEALAMEFGIEVTIEREPSAEEKLADRFADIEANIDEAELTGRPAVVTILGHVDHGKTSLLDKIRNTNVVAGESGGITQHVAAFDVTVQRNGADKQVTFIDTPGHQAFTAMRARGAQVTDIVVLVVDAAQGLQPQTIESINHARAAEVPIVVALNKIDRPDANPDKVLGELAAQDLNPSEWGGDTEVVRTSAMTGQGIEELLEILDLQAELMELQAAPKTPARGRVIEARVAQGLGPVATVLVQHGTLKVGDVVLAGVGWGRVRALQKADGTRVKEAGPSTPVLVSGFNEVPSSGNAFYVMSDLDEAIAVAEERQTEMRELDLALKNKVSLDNLFDTVAEGQIRTINLIMKGDVQGSVETLKATVGQHNNEEVQVKIIHSAVGAVNQSDVELADASEAVIIGFHVGIDEGARNLAEQRGVEIRTYSVIYEIYDDIKLALSGLLEPEIQEQYRGTAEVRATFKASRIGTIAGSYVTDGVAQRDAFVRLLRNGAVVADELRIEGLRRVKDDVREVKQGLECGISIAGYDDIKEGDKLEFYVREEVARSL
jgi:translation initiation factor IF-2